MKINESQHDINSKQSSQWRLLNSFGVCLMGQVKPKPTEKGVPQKINVMNSIRLNLDCKKNGEGYTDGGNGSGERNNELQNIEQVIRRLEILASNKATESVIRHSMKPTTENDEFISQLGLDALSNDLSGLKAKFSSQSQWIKNKSLLEDDQDQQLKDRDQRIHEQSQIILGLELKIKNMENQLGEKDQIIKKLNGTSNNNMIASKPVRYCVISHRWNLGFQMEEVPETEDPDDFLEKQPLTYSSVMFQLHPLNQTWSIYKTKGKGKIDQIIEKQSLYLPNVKKEHIIMEIRPEQSWSTEKLTNWISNDPDLSRYAQSLMVRSINGQAFKQLTREDLIRMHGINDVSHLNKIKDIQEQMNEASEEIVNKNPQENIPHKKPYQPRRRNTTTITNITFANTPPINIPPTTITTIVTTTTTTIAAPTTPSNYMSHHAVDHVTFSGTFARESQDSWECGNCGFANSQKGVCEICAMEPKRDRQGVKSEKKQSENKDSEDNAIVKEGYLLQKKKKVLRHKWDRIFVRLTRVSFTYWKEDPNGESTPSNSISTSGTSMSKENYGQIYTENSSDKSKMSRARRSRTMSLGKSDDEPTRIELLDIQLDTGVTPFQNSANNKYGFMISTSQRNLKFQAEGKADCQEWVAKLKEVIANRYRLVEQLELQQSGAYN